MVRCPGCFRPLPTDRFAWLCNSKECEPEPDEVATAHAGFTVRNRPVMHTAKPADVRKWTPPQSVDCTACHVQTSDRVCCYCHFGPLPEDWYDSNTTCIAMTGARTTGKSFYIGVAVKQLELLAVELERVLDFADDRTKSLYQRFYEKPLYEDRGIIEPTAPLDREQSPTRYPLIFSFGIYRGQRQYVVLRDVAGEDLERDSVNSVALGFVANADCVLFLFDPMRVPAIADQLRDLVEQNDSGADPQLVLGNVLRVIGSGAPNLAIVLAKVDTLHELRHVKDTTWSLVMSNIGSAILRDPGLTTLQYDERDAELLDAEVRSLLATLGADSFMLALDAPTNGNRLEHRYFAVSALGESVRNTALSTRGIAPFRCLDPLRWAMTWTGAL